MQLQDEKVEADKIEFTVSLNEVKIVHEGLCDEITPEGQDGRGWRRTGPITHKRVK
jgi:hypothetical protein